MADTEQLSGLRDSIAGVDRALLELLRRRMTLAAQIGRIKAEAAQPVAVRDVEDRVLSHAREQAVACGVSEHVYRATREALEELVALVGAGDEEGFRSSPAAARQALNGDA